MTGIQMFIYGGITYTITTSTTSVNEGSSVTFTITTVGFGTGTLYWTIATVSGTINNADFSSPASAVTAGGSVSITANSGSFVLTLANDLTTEGTESFNVSLRTGSTAGTIVRTSSTITVADTSLTPVAPTPVAPTPVAPTPVAPVAPTPVAPTPVAPTPVAPTPVPVAPVAPVAPTPVAPTCPGGCPPIGGYPGFCVNGTCVY